MRNDASSNFLSFLNGERLFQDGGKEREREKGRERKKERKEESFGDESWEKKKRDGEKNGHELQSMVESFNLNEQNHFHSHFSSNHNRSTRARQEDGFWSGFCLN